MTYLTKDNRFRETYEKRKEGEVIHNMCEVLDKIEERGRKEGIEKGLSAMISTLKTFLTTPEEIWSAIIKNEPYQNVTLQQVKKYF